MSKRTALIDADYIKYQAASAGEKRTIEVTFKATGDTQTFNTRTEFYGHWAKKEGGWLAEANKTRTSPLTVEEFSIVDVQTPDPIENILHTTRLMYESCYKALGTKYHKGSVGKGDSFRVERSTLVKYKGNRSDLIKPIHLEAVEDYLVRRLNCEVATGIENDDWLVIESVRDRNNVIVGLDKDYYGQPVKFLNVNRVEEGIQKCNQFGKLWLDDKSNVRGIGRLFLYWQVSSNDESDGYAANCVSKVKWAGKSAYKQLVNCKDDKEAFEVMVEIYKKLYPEPTVVKGWRGDDICIDWLYVFQECFTMARMLRVEDEKEIQVTDILNKLEINYDN